MRALWGVDGKAGMVASAYRHPATRLVTVTDHRTAGVHVVGDLAAAQRHMESLGLAVVETDDLLRTKGRQRRTQAV